MDYRTSKTYIADMVKRLMEESKGKKDDGWVSAWSRTPFAKNIIREEYHVKLTLPIIASYKRTTDPKPHLYKYSWHMDAVRCGCFSIFLEGVSSFTRLSLRSIFTFDELAWKFLEQFRLYTVQPKDAMSLSGFFQGPNESLNLLWIGLILQLLKWAISMRLWFSWLRSELSIRPRLWKVG